MPLAPTNPRRGSAPAALLPQGAGAAWAAVPLLPGLRRQLPALLTRLLIAEAQRVEVISEAVLRGALVLVGVSRVAALLPAVPEEPAGTERGECGQEVALASLPAVARHCPQAAGEGRQTLTSIVCGGGQGQPGKAHLCQWWSLLSTAGLPTTISRALALVMATLSL